MKALDIGSEGREHRQEHKKRAIEKRAMRFITHQLPCLYEEKPTPEVYKPQFERLLIVFEKEFTTAKEFRVARAYLSKYIDQGNANEDWSLPVPAYPMQIKASKNFRTRSWFHCMSVVAAGYEHLNDYLDNSSQALTSNDALTMALLSAAIHGGLCEVSAFVQFANLLIDEKKPLQNHENKYWVDLIISGSGMPQNTRDNDGNASTLRRWFLDNHTLLWIYRFKSAQDNNQTKEIDASFVLARIKQLFKRAGFDREIPTNSLRVFLKSCIGITETLPSVRLANSLSQYSIGDLNSASLPADQYLLLCCSEDKNSYDRSGLNGLSIKDFDEINYQCSGGALKPRKGSWNKNLARLIREINIALNGPTKTAKKYSATKAREALQGIREDNEYPIMITILIDWLIYLLKERKLEASSVARYYSSIGKKWLEATIDFDISDKEGEDYLNLYDGILDSSSSEKSKAYDIGRLVQLHEYGVKSKVFPYIPNLHQVKAASSFVYVNSGYIPTGLYNELIEVLENLQGATQDYINGLKCIAVLAMRTGMRQGEILKLRLQDIENSDELFIFITNNIYGNNKSSSALRKLPLKSLLTLKELDFVRNYVARRNKLFSGNKQSLLFSPDLSPTIPINNNQITRLFNFILRQLSGVKYTFHHFRHTALSNLQVILSGEAELLYEYQTFPRELDQRVLEGLAPKRFKANSRDANWIVAGIAGHSSPGVTLGTYFHFIDQLVARAVNKQIVTRSTNYLIKHIGLSESAIKRLQKEVGCKAAEIPVNQLQGILAKKLTKSTHLLNVQSQEQEVACGSTQNSKSETKIRNKLSECMRALELYEQGASSKEIYKHLNEKNTASEFLVTIVEIDSYIKSAIALAQIKTAKGASRLIATDLKPLPRGLRLRPAKPRSYADAIDAENVIRDLRDIYNSHKTEINWAVNYFIFNTDTSSSSIKFTNQQDLTRFLNIMLLVTKERRWNVSLYLFPGNRRYWKSNIGRKLKVEITENKKVVKNRAVLNFLHIKNKDYIKNNSGFGKYSSNALRYVFHSLAMLIGPTVFTKY
jgi:integrase